MTTTTSAPRDGDAFPGSTVRHGTLSGWKQHQLDGDDRPCDPCYFAKQAYDQRRLTAPDKKRLNRLRARAQGKAETALRHRYPDEYRELYQEFVATLLAEDETT